MERTIKIKEKSSSYRIEAMKKFYYKFSRNPLSVVGLVTVILIFLLAIFANQIAPFPDDVKLVTHMEDVLSPPSLTHLAGTDEFGRDVLSRMLIGLRYSLLTSLIVLSIDVPIGVSLGLLAGYYRNTWVESLIMRFTDLFMSIPTLVTTMVICSLGSGGWLIGALAMSVSWWAWYCRMAYNSTRSVSNELYVTYAELSGVKVYKVIFSEVFPNIATPILTKMSLDFGSVIIISSSLNFLGLGVQPPTPSLGSMVSRGIGYMPDSWWYSIFPAILVVIIVLGFNLLGDGLGDAWIKEDK